MSHKITIILALIMCLFAPVHHSYAQGEHKGPLVFNAPVYQEHSTTHSSAYKKTTLSLPFFEDFTSYDLFPDHSRWVENQVYINNTMCLSPISRGVATFDALNEMGKPWNPFSNTALSFADSLTSQPFDFSGYSPADSLYLSFFYQPQGNGFFPLEADSLFLFFRDKYGNYKKVWKMAGSRVKPFTQVMIPITDTLNFYNGFQFRFANIAALNYSDAIWNLDYIRLDINRNRYDTAINEVAFTTNPTFLLNDYTAMPYRQFYANAAGERTANLRDSVRNNNNGQTITYTFAAKDLGTGTTLQSPVTNTATLPPYSITGLTNAAYTTTVTPPALYDKVVFEHKYYIESTTTTGTKDNDTIVKHQVFDNYLAYDDGTAEQSYYLTLLPTLPGKIAIEYHLNTPDTMQGMAIYFGRQAPLALFKTFDIHIYSALAGVNGSAIDNLVYQQYNCDPGYPDTINHFWTYKFDEPLPLPAGTFYAGVFLPAESGADSLYFGLDINRIGGNHAYYNVLSAWNPSSIQGAIMMRPLLGQPVTSSAIKEVGIAAQKTWSITPNPATNEVNIAYPGDRAAAYKICTVQGQVVMQGKTINNDKIDISMLPSGMYMVTITVDGIVATPQKLIKL